MGQRIYNFHNPPPGGKKWDSQRTTYLVYTLIALKHGGPIVGHARDVADSVSCRAAESLQQPVEILTALQVGASLCLEHCVSRVTMTARQGCRVSIPWPGSGCRRGQSHPVYGESS